MKSLIVTQKYNNKKLNMFLQDNFDGLTSGTFYKALRKKDILINGIRIKENTIIHTGDTITIYITDNLLFKQFNPNIVFEDNNILIVDKPTGIEVINQNKAKPTLTSLLLDQKNYSYLMPCHRLDRNTTGLVLFSKNEIAHKIIMEKFKKHEIEKYYKCMVYGIPKKSQSTLEAYLFKDNKKSLVYIYDEPRKGTVKIITSYKIIKVNKKDNTSVLEINLHTGKTHQIRAHLAHIGHPIIGDREIWKK